MRRIVTASLSLLCSVMIICSAFITSYAHSGRTDGSGGHRDNKNKSGLGSYHYHCGGHPAHLHDGGYCPYTDKFPSRVSIKIEKTTLRIGEKVEISASVYPEDSCDTDVFWDSSDESVAVVSGGMVEARGYGTATLTAESFNGKKKTVKITVKEISAKKVKVSGLPDASEFYIGDRFQLQADITPDDVDDPSITWSSSDDSVAAISSDGSVQLRSVGKATLEATASNGKVGKVTVQVKEKVVETVEISDDQLDIFLGDQYQLEAVVSPSDATYPELTWTAEDPDIVTVLSDGKIQGNSCGQTTITAMAVNGVSDQIQVNISEIKAETITITAPETLQLGQTHQLEYCLLPSDTTDREVVWSSADQEIIEISQDGTIVAKGLGKTTIYAVQKDVQTSLEVEVRPIPVEEIQILSDAGHAVDKGETAAFSAQIYPSDANSNITWSTSDPEIAMIDQNGVLTALKGGVVRVIATSEDGVVSEYQLEIKGFNWGVPGAAGVVLSVAVVTIFVRRRKLRKKDAK